MTKKKKEEEGEKERVTENERKSRRAVTLNESANMLP